MSCAKTFYPLKVSIYYATCGMPLNLDPYRYCPFQCEYCFMKNRVIGKRVEDREPNINWVRYKFKKVFDDKDIIETNFLEMLLKNDIDIHCGTKSEAFQPPEKEKQFTKQLVDICNEYDRHIVFTTKADTYYDVDVNPEQHSFQFSVTNHYNDRYLEPNIPSFEKRVEFYKQLKDEGFKVGIRFEPTIPNVTDIDKIVSYFPDADHFHFAKLTLSNQLKWDDLIKYIGCTKNDFHMRGKKVVKDELFYTHIKPSIEKLDENGYSWSSRFIHLGTDKCCCGDELVRNPTTFNTLYLKNKYGKHWTLENALDELGEYKQCDCKYLYTSNNWGEGLKTVEDFYIDRFPKHATKFNPDHQFQPYKTLMDFL